LGMQPICLNGNLNKIISKPPNLGTLQKS